MKTLLIGCAIVTCHFVAAAQNPGSTSQESTRVAVKSLQNNIWKYQDKDKQTTSFFSIDDNQHMSLLVINGKDSMRFPDYYVSYPESKPDEILFITIIDTLGSKYFCYVKVMQKDSNVLDVKQAYTITDKSNPQNRYEVPKYGTNMEFKQINCCTNHDPHHCVNGLNEMLSFSKSKKCTF
jgi:hypothetical protein